MTERTAAACPFRIDRPVMRQRWQRLTFLHWQVEPQAVQRLLPDWLQPELFDGAAWVGLVPFFMHVATPGGRELPWVSRFCETNVRTYVRDRAGRTGIWFCSLDAARLGAVAVARTTYKLPYFWSQMQLTENGDQVSYRCRRKLPGPRWATSVVSIDIGDRYQDAELEARDHFLTARWILFTTLYGKPTLARASHPPWPLHRAQVRELDDRLIAAAGLPAPQAEPLVHYSPGVDVAIGRPEPGG
ncbi:MAG: YqjF family protein [Streptosporangiaceae bacterium]